ncbi:Os01g0656700 [Oryza sativa Japonica Group]|uniref:Os01g0656700 protein n=1 Tax=Oryza sativa subsp. japonica TaxID=39947 RepID=A0A0P0V624_ORYSJ|nr:Os01g0656700 [Oryza sativa Japonica Group]
MRAGVPAGDGGEIRSHQFTIRALSTLLIMYLRVRLLGGDWVCSFVWCFVGALDAVAPEPANALGSLLLKLHPGGLLRWLVSSLKRAGSSSTTIAGVTLESSAKTQIFRHYDEVDHDNAACSVCFVALAPWLLPPR